MTSRKASMVFLALLTFACVATAHQVDSGRVVLEKRRTTVDRLNVMLEKSIAEIAAQVSRDTLSVRVASHPESDVLHAMAMSSLGKHTVMKEAWPTADLLITPVDVSTRYELTESVDSVDRVLSVKLNAVLTEHNSKRILATDNFIERERMPRAEALRLQSTQRPSTSAPIPPVPATIWDDVLQPVIFVAAAVTTVVLLFTVRSK